MNTSWLPSRRVIGLVIVPMLTVFVLWIIGQREHAQEETERLSHASLGSVLAEESQLFNERDSDQDGLRDWEEFLYETSINDADSDDDGLDDFTEVIDPKRDPLVPDSHLGRTINPLFESASSSVGSTTLSYTVTEQTSRELYNAFAQLRQADNPEVVQDILLERISQSVVGQERVGTRYSSEDIAVGPSPRDRTDRGHYLALYREAILPAVEESVPDATVLLVQYSQSKDPNYLHMLNTSAQVNRQVVDNLLALAVPESVALLHVELINNLDIVTQHTQAMAQAQEDPLGAIIAAGHYVDDNKLLEQTLYGLSLYFAGEPSSI